MRQQAHTGLIAIVMSLLAACGGDGGGSGSTTPPPVVPPPSGSPPPPTAPTAEDLANARNSQLKVTLRLDTNFLTISWTDTFASETGYLVESRLPDGTWQTLASQPLSNGTGGALEVSRTIDLPTAYRVSAVMTGYTVPLQTPAAQSEVTIEPEALPANFVAPPVNWLPGTLQLRVNTGTRKIQDVTYSLGSDLIGTSTGYPIWPVNWDTTTVPNDTYTLTAAARMDLGAFIELHREFVVNNANLAASLQVSRVAGSLNNFAMDARATSAAGVNSVEFFVDDVRVSTQSGTGASEYTYTHAPSVMSSGAHTFKVVVRDNAGATVEKTRQITFDNPPALTLASTQPESIVASTLHVEGTFGDEQPGTTLTVSLGNTTVMQTSMAGAFSVDHSLAGVEPGEYTLTARAIDSEGHHTVVTRNVVVASSQSAVELIATDVQSIIDTDEGAVLYKKLDGSVILRNASGQEVALQIPPDRAYIYPFDLDAGYVATGYESDNVSEIFVFGPDGRATNISASFGNSANYSPQLFYPWLVWTARSASQPSHLEIYNLVTQARTTVNNSPLATGSIGDDYAFVTTPGAEQVLFSAPIGWMDVVNDVIQRMFLHNFTSGVTETMNVAGNWQFDPQTDNTRIAWRISGRYSGGTRLVAGLAANPASVSEISASITDYMLGDGLLAWTEPNTDGSALLKVNDTTATTTITSSATSAPFVRDGRVSFQDHGKVYVWKSGTGKQVLLGTLPTSGLRHDDGIGFFTKGETPSQRLYRMQLP